jgi:beta-lactamase regulating signal transducer with metallopeptidase domain
MTDHIETAVRFIVAALLAGLWQAPLFALAAWLVLRLRPGLNATTRHSVFAAALSASVVLPIVTASLAMPKRDAASASASRQVIVTFDGSAAALRRASQSGGVLRHEPARATASHASTGITPPVVSSDGNAPLANVAAPQPFVRPNLTLPRPVAFGVAALWFGGASFVLVRLLLALVNLERLKRNALPLSVTYRAHLERWAAAPKGSRTVRLCTSADIDIPVAVGLFDAMILLPQHLLDELQPAEIDSIVLHELAHLRRADDWINAVERVVQALMFFNPGVMWLAAQLDLEREVACDDWVLQQNDALRYATCLAKVVETAVWPYGAVPAPGAFVTRRGMSIRIERILAKHRDVRVRTSLGSTSGAVALIGALGIVAAVVSPSIAYDLAPPAPAAPPAPPAPAIVQKSIAAPVRPPATPHTPAAPHAVPHAAPAAPAAPAVSIVVRDVHVDVRPRVSVRPHPSATAMAIVSLEHAADALRKQADYARSQADRARSQESHWEQVADAAEERASEHAEVIADANDPDYVDELAEAGYSGLSVDQLVQLKSVGVDSNYICALRRAGVTHASVPDLVRMRAVGLDGPFVAAMRKYFGATLPVDEIVALRAVGVSRTYLDQLSSAGFHGLSARDVQSLRALNVTAKYLRDLADAGYPSLSPEEVQQLAALGVDHKFLEKISAHGFVHLKLDELIKLKATGVL